MSDIELVIKIPEEVYKAYKRNPTLCTLNAEQEFIAKSYLINGLINGTPLPKGHGRLIDADEFHRTLEDMPIKDNDKWFNWLQKACNRLAEASTIIEADKESEG